MEVGTAADALETDNLEEKARYDEGALMADIRRPAWSNTWWSKRHTIVNVTLVVVILLYIVWTSIR